MADKARIWVGGVDGMGPDGAVARALRDALAPFAETKAWIPGVAVAGGVDVVVHVAPGLTAGDGLDDVLQDAVEDTRAARQLAEEKHAVLVLVSRLSAIGAREGLIVEDDVQKSFFGGTAKRGADVDLDVEAAAIASDVDHAIASASFADVRSQTALHTHDDLVALGGAASGTAFARALDDSLRTRRRDNLRAALRTRADGGKFPDVRGYGAAVAELIATRDATTPTVVVRVPDVLGDDLHSATAALWQRASSEGIPTRYDKRARVEALPLAVVVRALAVVARGAVASRQGGVVHIATSDRSPLTLARFFDLVDLSARRTRKRGVVTKPQALPALLLQGAKDVAAAARELAPDADKPSRLHNLAKRALGLADTATAAVVDDARAWSSLLSAPPVFTEDTRFSQRQLRVFAVRAGVAAADAAVDVDWRAHLLDAQFPAWQRAHDAIAAPARVARPAWDSLGHLLVEIAERYRLHTALSHIQPDNSVVDVTYIELLARARAVALRLQRAGVVAGDRVVLSGANGPAWSICAFGVMLARATLVPLDPGLPLDAVENIIKKAKPTLALLDKERRDKWSAAFDEKILDIALTAVEGPGIDAATPLPTSTELASILFTSGTTGEPKGVMLSHGNFCALLSSLQSIFPVGAGDRMLSVLPLHHTFEFSCGLLMPLAAGARIYTPDALTGERVLYALKAGRITALLGIPALWQLLERRINSQVQERGDDAAAVIGALLSANRAFGKRTGKSFGKLLLKPIHDQLGGHLRILISGGSALPPSAHELFQGLGLPLAEGYGLTEAAPVLSVAEGVHGGPPGTVGRPIPGVEVKIVDADPATGVGEVWAKGPNVMQGYFENVDATRAVLEDGWLKTGDLGRFDDDGRLRLVGRSKDVVVTSTGENIYLDDMEKRLENIEGIDALTLLGIVDPRGGERLALVAVPKAKASDAAAWSEAQKAIAARVLKLPAYARPAVTELREEPLPLTATRKVKRKEVKAWVEALLQNRAQPSSSAKDAGGIAAVRQALATVAGVEVGKVHGDARPAQDLGFDSLMWVELGSALEAVVGKLDPEKLAACETVADVEALVRTSASQSPRAAAVISDDRATTKQKASRMSTARKVLLPVAKPAGRSAIAFVQREMFNSLFRARVTGRSFIPHNQNTIVVANHTSHLDTGLVKYALGSYGTDLRPLAAKDYFFEGNEAKVAFFEHFTNLVPIDRETGSGLAFEQARAVVEGGHVVLIFPEGTRREDGTLGSFKPLVARLSLATGVGVLPIWMKGNYEALPRGVHVPNLQARHLEAHIGPLLPAVEMARLTAHLTPVQAARASTEIIRKAVVALSEGAMLDLSQATSLDALDRGVVARADEDAA